MAGMGQTKSHPVRLAVLMLLGAIFGLLFIAMLLMAKIHGYDHGYGETPRCDLVGALVGAVSGLLVELALRIRFRRPRFTLRDLLVFLSLSCGLMALGRWCWTILGAPWLTFWEMCRRIFFD